MWTSILSMLFGTLPTIATAIVQAKQQQLNAKTEQERIAASERIKVLEAQRDVLIADSKSPWDTIGRLCLMAPFGIYAWKIVVYDKVLDLGSTDPLDSNFWMLMFTVFGFYFVQDITRLIKRG